MREGFQMDWKSSGEYQQALGDVLWQTEDHHEGVNSFFEERGPRFRGRSRRLGVREAPLS